MSGMHKELVVALGRKGFPTTEQALKLESNLPQLAAVYHAAANASNAPLPLLYLHHRRRRHQHHPRRRRRLRSRRRRRQPVRRVHQFTQSTLVTVQIVTWAG